MDPLSDILTGLRIRRAMFTRLEASAPWGFDSSGEPFLKFVLLVRGSAILTTADHPEPIALRGGDVFIMLQDQPYRIYDHEDSATTACVDIEKLRIGNRIEVGGGGALTSFISGFFELDSQAARPLMKVLPPLLHLKLDKEDEQVMNDNPVSDADLDKELEEQMPGYSTKDEDFVDAAITEIDLADME